MKGFARLGAALAAALVLAVTARAQGAPASSDFAAQYSAAASSSARLDAVMGAIRSDEASQAAWLINDFSAESVPGIRAWMIRGVADLAPQKGLSFFEQGLKDPSAWVRLAAADALGKMGGAQAVSDLSAVLASEKNPGVRQSAASWLGRIGGTSAITALGQRLQFDANPNVRLEAAWVLSRMRGAQAAQELRKGRNDADERVRRAAGGR
ncbi:MAG TPA: HEAT repeat domain-containing protein [Elusimicrobiota bacterium]|nr:HEAT repeat domain-containing protein [Elusimicrobiota bacterium]